jgi:hypothetical protein
LINDHPKDDEVDALVRYSDFIYDSPTSYCGALVHDPTLSETLQIDEKGLLGLETADMGDKDESGEGKPKLYLHVGPPKHATTSLQCNLATHQVRTNFSLSTEFAACTISSIFL